MKAIIPLLAGALFAISATAQPQEANSINIMGLKILQSLVPPGSSTNITVSPYSIADMLHIIRLGTQGTTRTELDTVLGNSEQFNTTRTVLDKARPVKQSFISSTFSNKKESPFTLISARKLFVDNHFKINNAYTNQFEEEVIARQPFSENQEQARISINQWGAKSTNNLIKEIIPPTMDLSQSRIIAASALYFLGKWEVPFKKFATTKQDFLAPQGKTTVDMMSDKRIMPYKVIPGIGTSISLSYKWLQEPGSPEPVFIAVLPESKKTIGDFLGALSPRQLEQCIPDQKELVLLGLPKFKTDGDSLSINPGLQKAGPHELFIEGKANLSLISPTLLHLVNVLQKCFVSVDEEKTEAAAVTAGIIDECIPVSEPPFKTLTFDRPFLWFIYDKTTGSILFMGVQNNPGENDASRDSESLPPYIQNK